MSVRPVCRPFKLHSVAPWRTSRTIIGSAASGSDTARKGRAAPWQRDDRRWSCGSGATCASTSTRRCAPPRPTAATSCRCSSTIRRSTVPAPGRQAYLRVALHALRASMGGALVVRRGDPLDVVPAVAAEVGARAVHLTRDYGPYGRRRDAAVIERLRAAEVAVVATGSPYAVAPGSVRKGDGTPYRVFTPFSRAWAQLDRQPAAGRSRRRLARRPRRAPPTTCPATRPPPRAAGDRRVGGRPAVGRVPRWTAGPLRHRPQPPRPAPGPAGCRPTCGGASSIRAACWPTSTPTAAGQATGSPPSSPGASSTPTCCCTAPSRPGTTWTRRWTRWPSTPMPPPGERFDALGVGHHRLPDRRRRDAPAARRSGGCTTGCAWSRPASSSRTCTCRGGGARATSCSTSSTATWRRTTTAGSGPRAPAPMPRRTSGCSTRRRSRRSSTRTATTSVEWIPELADVAAPTIHAPGRRSAAARGYPAPMVDHARRAGRGPAALRADPLRRRHRPRSLAAR